MALKRWSPETAARTLKLFCYGDPGAGKTTFCATAVDDPRTSPALWINCGGNPESLYTRKTLPDILSIEATKDVTPIYDWIAGGQNLGHPFVKTLNDLGIDPAKMGTPYKSLVLDGITEYQRICIDEITGNISKKPGEKLATVSGFGPWQDALQLLTKLARLFYGLPNISTFITGLETQKTDAQTGFIMYDVMLWGQGRGEVPAYSLLTMRMTRQSKMDITTKTAVNKGGEKPYSVGYIDQVGKFIAKEQYGGNLAPYYSEPTVTMLMDAIYGKVAA